jgi:phosphatidylglycerophosphatase A
VPRRSSASPHPERAPRRWALRLVATGAGLGYLPMAPGSAASLVGALLCYPLLYLGWPLYFGAAIVLSAIAVYASDRVAAELGQADPPQVVIDEMAGMWLAALAIPPHAYDLVAVLLLFRLFDVVKPVPIPLFERFAGGWGIVLDDVVAGLLARAAWWLLKVNFDFL